ncbi:MAG: hypothetical protein M1830_003037 [Pleopsidium flavum]|nr:MAG: hypothetical protein M1830_003037 [Pleopsidium flavum]
MSRGSVTSFNPQPSTDFIAMQKLVQRCSKSSRVTLQSIEEMPGHLHRLRLLVLSDGSRLVLKLSPPPNQGFLRHERHSLDTAAILLELLRSKTSIQLPQIVKWDGRGKMFGSPFVLTTYTRGTSLRDLLPYMTRSERDSTERQMGRLMAVISCHTSPSFGPVAAVHSGRGFSSWRQAFRCLVESVLRDAEDFLVSLPYPEIREQIERFGSILDDITEARLVVLSGRDPASILLDSRTKEVIGLLDFGNAVWGDTLMLDSFADPSKAFMEGFGVCLERNGAERIRQLLATVAIVTQFYRPQQDGNELAARKTLTSALAQLAVEVC